MSDLRAGQFRHNVMLCALCLRKSCCVGERHSRNGRQKRKRSRTTIMLAQLSQQAYSCQVCADKKELSIITTYIKLFNWQILNCCQYYYQQESEAFYYAEVLISGLQRCFAGPTYTCHFVNTCRQQAYKCYGLDLTASSTTVNVML